MRASVIDDNAVMYLLVWLNCVGIVEDCYKTAYLKGSFIYAVFCVRRFGYYANVAGHVFPFNIHHSAENLQRVPS